MKSLDSSVSSISHPVMNEYRTGIIGCGNIGSKYDENRDLDNVYTHAGMVHQTPGLKLVAATDIDQQRLFRCGQYWGVDRLYHDYLEMLREEELELVLWLNEEELIFYILPK